METEDTFFSGALCKNCHKEIFIGSANIKGVCDCTTCRGNWKHRDTGLTMCAQTEAEPLTVEDVI